MSYVSQQDGSTGHLLTGYYNHQNNTVASRTRQAQRRLPAHGKRLEKPR
jgi:hypothetical protein